MKRRGYESYVAKDEASLYIGSVTRAWHKVKQAGWTVGEDRWRRRISRGAVGSLIGSAPFGAELCVCE